MSLAVASLVLLVTVTVVWASKSEPLQTDRRNGRISILGIWQPDRSFKYALACGSFKSESYIKVIDWIAEQASETLRTTGRMTVVVQDNGSLHTSHLTRQQWQRWRSLGLFLFFLPQYCSEMNRIEDEWHQLKTQEKALGVCSRMNMT